MPEPPVYEDAGHMSDDYAPMDDDYAPMDDDYEPAPAYYEAPAAEVNEPKKSEAAQPPMSVAEILASTHVEAPVAAAPVRALDPVVAAAPKNLRKVPYLQAGPADWTEIYLGLGVTGILQSTVANCQLINRQGNDFYFVLDKANSTLFDVSHEKRLSDLLTSYFVEQVRAHIQLGEITAETPALMAIRVREERLQDAISAIKNDPIVQQLIAQFGATLREDTIQPI